MTDEQTLAAAAVDLAAAALTGAEVEASADRHHLALTRFANSVIHQNVAEDVTRVRLRLHHDGRTAAAAGTVTGERDLGGIVERAVAAVAVAPADPGWPGLAPPADVASAPPLAVGPTAADRARAVAAFVAGAGGLETAGYCRSDHWRGAFANSAGQVLSGEASELGFSGIARHTRADRVADGVARLAPLRLEELDGAALGARAAAKARAGARPVELPPGRYEVVLEPTAVADLLETFAAAGFNGKAVNERRSFVRLGDAQFDPAITLVDDPLAVGLTYDNEGTPRRRLVLADRGTTVSLTHDRRTAAEAGAQSTGHALAGAFTFGPYARHLCLLPAGDANLAPDEAAGPPADASVAALVTGVERGLLVSDLWYTRMLDPRTLAITGLTRNGVWLIEHGEVTRPVLNLRFTQSYAQALAPGNVVAVGAAATPVPGDTYTATSPRWTCPALRLASWNFTGGASG
jgi:predicted Zn-dependent protease